MTESTSNADDTGLLVLDLRDDAAFAQRPAHPRDPALQMDAMRRIAHAFAVDPHHILQALVESAVALCGADSAGISIEKTEGTDEAFYHWVATAGQYSGFLDAILPRYPSACGICLERGTPQTFLVRQRFFDIMGIEAPLVLDGILLPWRVDQMRGTIFIMSHNNSQAFDVNDVRMMQILADFAATGVRQQEQQQRLLEQAGAAASAAMANQLAHKINNPLQSLTNLLFLAAQGDNGVEAREIGRLAAEDLARLSTLVKQLLALPSVQPSAG
jgi:signal transduction histidine kinase